MNQALISPVVLRWARERSRLEQQGLAEIANVKHEKLQLWERGETRPTFRQAQDLAKALHIPFGYLFLQKPPVEKLPIPDLRTVGDHAIDNPSTDLRDLLTDTLRKQEWYRDHLLDQGAEPLAFVGRFDANTVAEKIVDDMTSTLGLSLAEREKMAHREDFLRLLLDKAERAGIAVLRSGIVGSNSHRGLDVQEFRGFAISDSIAPFIFINSKDAKAGQIFTLMHELAHIWIGQSGITDISLTKHSDAIQRRSEKLCNAVAAQILVPREFMKKEWSGSESIEENVDRMARHFRVSTVVVARRAFDIGLITWSVYSDYYRQQAALWQRKNHGDGGNSYRNILARNGRQFSQAVVGSALARNLLLRDAGRLLGLNPSKIVRLAQEMGIG